MANPMSYLNPEKILAFADPQNNLASDFLAQASNLDAVSMAKDGSVSGGVKNLISLSKAINSGCGNIPSGFLQVGVNALSKGAEFVLGAVGVSPTMMQGLQKVNAQGALEAVNIASGIFDRVKEGKLRTKDYKNIAGDLLNVKRVATDALRGEYTKVDRRIKKAQELDRNMPPSPYAMDLIAKAPKHRFMFVVSFIYETPYNEMGQTEFAFVVKTTSRLKVKYITENANYYNYRTKYIVRTEYDSLSLSFYDDIDNQLMTFIKMHMDATIPVSQQRGGIGPEPEKLGMDFASPAPSTASFAPYTDQTKNVIRCVRLFHVYDSGNSMNVFEFIRPKITEIELDDLTMSETGDGCEGRLTLDYDSVHLELNVAMNDPRYNIKGETDAGKYPLRYNESLAAAKSRFDNNGPNDIPKCDFGGSALRKVDDFFGEVKKVQRDVQDVGNLVEQVFGR